MRVFTGVQVRSVKTGNVFGVDLSSQVHNLSLGFLNTTIQGVPGGKDLTSGECSLGQTITI